MTALVDVLGLCPASDAEQRRLLETQYGLRTPADLMGAVVFGTGSLGSALARSLREQGLQPAAFSDNDPRRWGATIEGLQVVPPHDLESGQPIIIGSKFVKDIFAGLRDSGTLRLIPHYVLPMLFSDAFAAGFHVLSAETVTAGAAAIERVFSVLADNASRELFLRLLKFRITLDPLDLPDPVPDQYFPPGFWALSAHEVFVDAGACVGDTLAEFVRRTHGDFTRYFAFEPDPQNLGALRRLAEELADTRVIVLPFGVGDRHVHAAFEDGRGGESRIASDGTLDVELVPIDDLVAGEMVTTIKIDVEGFEREALAGARQTIAKRGPKLAVSVYHRLPDLWELPLWILRCRGDYELYMRHHTAEIYDTVLYGICGEPAGSDARSRS